MKKFYEEFKINVIQLATSDVVTESSGGAFTQENYFDEELPLLPSIMGTWE